MQHADPPRRASRWPVLPDGSLQAGLGPGSWLVRSWSDAGAEALDLIDRLGSTQPPPSHTVGVEVQGTGELADSLRRSLNSECPPAHHDHATACPVVLVCSYLVPIGAAGRPGLAGRPVLPVVSQTGRVVVGPWTGLDVGPCLHCLDLHRRDRNACWPSIATALDDPLTALHPPQHTTTVLEVVRALTVLLVTSGGQDRTPGLAHEIGPRPPHVVTRRWARHARCPRHAGRPPDALGGTT